MEQTTNIIAYNAWMASGMFKGLEGAQAIATLLSDPFFYFMILFSCLIASLKAIESLYPQKYQSIPFFHDRSLPKSFLVTVMIVLCVSAFFKSKSKIRVTDAQNNNWATNKHAMNGANKKKDYIIVPSLVKNIAKTGIDLSNYVTAFIDESISSDFSMNKKDLFVNLLTTSLNYESNPEAKKYFIAYRENCISPALAKIAQIHKGVQDRNESYNHLISLSYRSKITKILKEIPIRLNSKVDISSCDQLRDLTKYLMVEKSNGNKNYKDDAAFKNYINKYVKNERQSMHGLLSNFKSANQIAHWINSSSTGALGESNYADLPNNEGLGEFTSYIAKITDGRSWGSLIDKVSRYFNSSSPNSQHGGAILYASTRKNFNEKMKILVQMISFFFMFIVSVSVIFLFLSAVTRSFKYIKIWNICLLVAISLNPIFTLLYKLTASFYLDAQLMKQFSTLLDDTSIASVGIIQLRIHDFYSAYYIISMLVAAALLFLITSFASGVLNENKSESLKDAVPSKPF
jgi:hypothetical protein